MTKQMIVGLCLTLVVLPLSLQAGVLGGWFGKKEGAEGAEPLSTNRVKRLHMTISGKDNEKELLQTLGAKQVVVRELAVLRLLADERRRDLESIDGDLSKQFGIERNRNYRYDAKTRSILEQEPPASQATNEAVASAKSKLVKKLGTDDDARKFAQMAATKQLFQEDLVVLARLLRSKEAAMIKIDQVLKEKYSMSRDRDYWYDTENRKLYEVIRTSGKGTVE